MVRALPSTGLSAFFPAAQTQPLAGGPADATTPILLGDIRNLPTAGAPANLPLEPQVQPTPPIWPAQPAPAQPAPQPQAPQPAWPQPPVQQQPPVWQQPPVPQQPPIWQQPIPGPQPGTAGGVVGVFGAIAQIGLTVFGGVMSIIDWFKSRRKKRKQQPAPVPVPAPVPLPPLQAGGNPPAPAATVRPAIDPQVAATLAEANRAIGAITDAVARLGANKAVAAGGPAAPAPLEAPAPTPIAAPAPQTERQRVLAQIMAQLLGLMTTLTQLLAKLVEKKTA